MCKPPQSSVDFNVYAANAVGGDAEFLKTRHKTKWIEPKRVDKVPCWPTSAYLADYFRRSQQRQHIDFFSLDVEGAELRVLETIDFNKVTIDVFLVEVDAKSGDVDKQSAARAIRAFLVDRHHYHECMGPVAAKTDYSAVFVSFASNFATHPDC